MPPFAIERRFVLRYLDYAVPACFRLQFRDFEFFDIGTGKIDAGRSR